MFMLAIGGLLIGPIVLTVSTLLLYQFARPGATQDAQFVLIVLFLVPLGLLLGLFTGLCAEFAKLRRVRASGLCGLLGGASAAVTVGYFIDAFANPGDAMTFLREPEWLVPTVWSIALLLWGLVVTWLPSSPIA
jgi:hypothetical protein